MRPDEWHTAGRSPGFGETRWSLVGRAGGEGEAARAALEELCAAYWYPVYALVRRRGLGADDAADVVQAFFAELLERRDLERADPGRGRFRAFLAGSLEHFLANWRRHKGAAKRGGGWRAVPLDGATAERRLAVEVGQGDDPAVAFERAWAKALLDSVLRQLAAEHARRGEQALFEALRCALYGDEGRVSYGELSVRLGRSPGALRVAAHKLRRQYGERLRSTIADTLADPADVEDELAALARALAR